MKDFASNQNRILSILSGCSSFEDVRRAGVLFHGTCETIKGPLRGGGYDGTFWTAEQPSIAQSYIPKSGISSWISKPDEWAMDKPMWPGIDENCPTTRWALAHAGVSFDDLDIKYDGRRVQSWKTPKTWPKERDFCDWLEQDMGYVPENGTYTVSMPFNGSNQQDIMPADWRLPGHLIICLPNEDFRIWDPVWSEEAMGYAAHNRVADFEDFAEAGRDAFCMNDQLQSDFQGNVGHRAIGVLPTGLVKMDHILIPACRHDGPDMSTWSNPETPEFVAFMCDLSPDYTPVDPGMLSEDIQVEKSPSP